MTKTEIANIALAKFREGRITTIESTTDPVAVVMNDQFDHALELLLEEHRWNFAGKRVTLTKLSEDPPFGWANQYALPSDCIRLKDVNGEDVEASSQLFTLEGSNLLTNDDTVTITYVAKITDTNLYSPSFVEALSFKLASITCGRLTGDTELAVMLDKQYNYALSKAVHNDTKADGSRDKNLMARMLNSSAILGGNNVGSGTPYPRSSTSSGSVAAHKHELTDLLQTGATDGQVVVWNDTEKQWEAQDVNGDVSTDAIFDAAGDLVVGTGADTAAKLPIGANGLVLKSNGTTAVWDAIAGTGDVVGDASSTDDAIARFDGVTGKAIQNSSVTIDDSGNIATTGTVDGRDLSVDGAKLDGIEASADVTDTINVTAAGALMDSEVTNLAQVKAFDAADYAAASHTHVASTDIVATGTPSATTYLRGDDTWATVTGGDTNYLPRILSLTAKTATFAAAIGETHVVDTSGGTFTANLPAVAGGQGRIGFYFVGTGSRLTLDPSGAETISGKTTIKIDQGHNTIENDGTEWKVVQSSGISPLRLDPAQITATQDGYNPADWGHGTTHLYIESDASREIQGFEEDGFNDMEQVVVTNDGAFDIVIKHETSTTVANRVLVDGGADFTLGANQTGILMRDGTVNKWRFYGISSGATQLSELSDVNTSTPTDKNVLVADGVDFESRALLIDDISDNVAASTGVLTGGVLTIGAPNTTFSISDGTGTIVDTTGAITNVSWTGQTNLAVTNLFTDLLTWVSINSSGTVVQRNVAFTADVRRTEVCLGVLVHVNKATVDAINTEAVVAFNPHSTAHDLAASLGFINVSGNVFSANGANVNLNKSAGEIFYTGSNYDASSTNPHVKTLPVLSALTFQYRFSDGSNGVTGTVIDPDNLDDGAGGLTAVGANSFSIQRITSFISNNVKIQRGVADYANLQAAIAGISSEAFVTEPSLKNGLLRGWLIVKKGATNLSDTTEAQFISAGKLGEVGGGGGSGGGGSVATDTIWDAAGDLVVADGSDSAVRLPIGTEGQVLKVSSGAVAWGTDTGGVTPDTAETSIWIDAGALLPDATAEASSKTGTNGNVDVMLMANTEKVYAKWTPPPQWAGGDISVDLYWTATGATAGHKVKWNVAAQAGGNDDAWDVAFPTPTATADDDVIASGDIHIIPANAITVGGTPADGDCVFLEIERTASGAPQMSQEAELLGVRVNYESSLIQNWYVTKMGTEADDASGTGEKTAWIAPAAGKIHAVHSGCSTATAGGALTVDAKKGGTTILSTLGIIDSTESSTSTGTAHVLTTTPTTFVTGDRISFDINTFGGTGAKGLHTDLLISWD